MPILMGRNVKEKLPTAIVAQYTSIRSVVHYKAFLPAAGVGGISAPRIQSLLLKEEEEKKREVLSTVGNTLLLFPNVILNLEIRTPLTTTIIIISLAGSHSPAPRLCPDL